jgi:hypothetical protein
MSGGSDYRVSLVVRWFVHVDWNVAVLDPVGEDSDGDERGGGGGGGGRGGVRSNCETKQEGEGGCARTYVEFVGAS